MKVNQILNEEVHLQDAQNMAEVKKKEQRKEGSK